MPSLRQKLVHILRQQLPYNSVLQLLQLPKTAFGRFFCAPSMGAHL
ncbi:hypothetical protein [Polaromonas sp. CG9_12]|nr:hypothetical protein [Polaromonas sp. CG9_12]